MELKKAFETVVKGIEFAQLKGVYTLQDSATLYQALGILNKYITDATSPEEDKSDKSYKKTED